MFSCVVLNNNFWHKAYVLYSASTDLVLHILKKPINNWILTAQLARKTVFQIL